MSADSWSWINFTECLQISRSAEPLMPFDDLSSMHTYGALPSGDLRTWSSRAALPSLRSGGTGDTGGPGGSERASKRAKGSGSGGERAGAREDANEKGGESERDKWNRTVVRRVSKKHNHSIKIKAKVRARGTRS